MSHILARLTPRLCAAATISLLLVLLPGCSTHEDDITHTNPLGIVIGSADGTDWCPPHCTSPYLQVDKDGHSTTALDGSKVVPCSYVLNAAYPNPVMSPGPVNIAFGLPVASRVTMYFTGRLGGIVRVLIDGKLFDAGYETAVWDLKDDRGNYLPPGIYRCFFTAGQWFSCQGDILVKGP